MNRKIIWAVDPYSDLKVNRAVMSVLKTAMKTFKASVEPVYVFAPNDRDGIAHTMGLLSVEHFLRLSKKQMDGFCKKINFKAKKGKVIFNRSESGRSSAHDLAKYARKSKADFVFLSSHARSGLNRFFIGSFAENYVLQTTVPTIIVSPKMKSKTSLNRFFYATDFSDASLKGYRNLVNLLHGSKAEIVLFSKVADPPVVFHTGPYAIARDDYVDEWLIEGERKAREHAEDWIGIAAKKGVKVRFQLSKQIGGVGAVITSTAKKVKADMICLSSIHNKKDVLLMGSVTRHVIRGADRPVMVLPHTI